jgi:hypothetical protein
LKTKVVLFLLICGVLFPKPSSTQQCLADCRTKCSAALDSCKKKAANKTALEGCQRSYELCGSNCVNKACTSAPSK